MPGLVPSVSTKTRGFIKPPAFHTDPSNLHNTTQADASYFASPFTPPTPFNSNRNQSSSPAGYHNSYDSSYQPAWKNSLNNDSSNYVPSYQKKVQANPRPASNPRPSQRSQQQNYRPASVQPVNLVHRQFNSPMSLYSNDNIQDVMKNHVSHISRIR